MIGDIFESFFGGQGGPGAERAGDRPAVLRDYPIDAFGEPPPPGV